MPKLPTRPLPSTWLLETGHGDGTGADAYYLIGASQAYNEFHALQRPPFEHWTHVLGFQGTTRTSVVTIPERLMKICWRPPANPYVVGDPEAIYEITPTGAQEIAVKGLPGVFAAMWGPDARSYFACGLFEAFALFGEPRKWTTLPLPADNGGLHHIDGFAADAVYFVGYAGAVLYWDGARLHPVPVPTSRTLVNIAKLDDRHLCITGYAGTLLYGNRKGFRLIPTGTDQPLLSIGRFGNAVWYGTEDGLWSFDGGSAPKLVLDLPVYWVNGLGDALTVFDGEKTYLFDGSTLTELDTTI
jgi:hypothetical protein